VRGWAPLAVASLAAAAACAGHPLLHRSGPARVWPATLAFAKDAAAGGRYGPADSALLAFASRYTGTREAGEADYWRALIALDPHNDRRSGSDAARDLDAYLASPPPRQHDIEAGILRRTAVAMTALRQATEQATSEADSARTREDSVRTTADSLRVARASRERTKDEEVQRLRDSLDKVDAQLTETTQELDRIKKRLAAPKP